MAWPLEIGPLYHPRGVARGIYNALTGIAGSKMLKQAEKDIVASPPPSYNSDLHAPRTLGGSSSGVSGGSTRGRGHGRMANRTKDSYGCGEKGHVRWDCPKNKSS
jgi:hypothetical protein